MRCASHAASIRVELVQRLAGTQLVVDLHSVVYLAASCNLKDPVGNQEPLWTSVGDAVAPMSGEEGEVPAPLVVEYDPITGVPSEFNEFLPKDCEEYKRWKATNEAALEGRVADLTLKDKHGNEIEKQLPGGKVKKKSKPEVVIERAVRNKKKCITTVAGLDRFGIKLAEASKLFGKKFASGASVTKNATGGEEIDIQGDVLDGVAELVVKTYGPKNGLEKKHVFYIDNKKKVPYFDDGDDDK